ncbi:MAG: hypothetical protein AAF597_00650 [Bacteroidota bacterium]
MLSQPLSLEFKKLQPRPILTVRRADGSTTWMKLYPGMALHDLAHYAIETELQLSDAFYGMLANGHNIEDFEAPREQRLPALLPANLPRVSLQVEHFVNLLMTELQNGAPIEGFITSLNQILQEAELGHIDALTEAALNNIRAEIDRLRNRWRNLPVGESLTLRME